jgi:D-glycero-D-manno-heptose 1,7-bisphosphate phosphatase
MTAIHHRHKENKPGWPWQVFGDYNSVMDPAIFLDRDGVVIENNPNYVRSWSDVFIYPHALSALARISKLNYRIVIVTNQSAVGRGLISLQDAQDINDRLVAEIQANGGRIDGVFMCPHAPEDNCSCRKPNSGLILEAARELSLDLKRSTLIGDALTDLQAGLAAGVSRNILVMTGRGKNQLLLKAANELEPFLVYENLFEALADLT